MRSELGLKATIGDPSLYAKHIAERLVGLSGVYFDDLLQTGIKEFKEFTEKTALRFISKTRIDGKGNFMGMRLEQSADRNAILLDMNRYYLQSVKHSLNRSVHSATWIRVLSISWRINVRR